MTSEKSSNRLEGIVELLLDDRELLIDKGPEDGVQVGMRFVVLGHAETQTASGRILELEFPKVIVKIVRFDSGLGVGRTFRIFKGRPPTRSFADVTLGRDFTGTPDRVETISAKRGSKLLNSLPNSATEIQPGDPVRETRGDEYLDED